MRRLLYLILSILLLTQNIYCETESKIMPQEISAENQTTLVELYRIRVQNCKDGLIETTLDGAAWETIGHVLQPTTKVNPEGFTASKWGKSGTIVASAVNAIHIKSGHNRKSDRGIVFSLLPSNSLSKNANNYASYLDNSSSIYTNIRGGTGIFGGAWSVFVGDLVYLEKENELTPLPFGYEPAINDRIVIIVRRPEPYPHEIIFENKAGGIITLKYLNGQTKPIGQVLKPVLGIGRFIGTEDSDVGRIRANHTGVIDISTSPLGKVGGFQIIPATHSESPEMASAKIKTQWMIVGPLNGLNSGEEGLCPLFSGYIIPRYVESDFYSADWQNKVTQRTLVSVQFKDSKTWEPMPTFYVDPDKPLPEKYNTVLENIEKIRILFPMFGRKIPGKSIQ